MLDHKIIEPSKPRIVSEEGNFGVYEIDGLYPGYGHTLGNSLRRIILSSLPGAAVTSVHIDGVSHEFSTIAGVKEDVVTILLNLKKIRFNLLSEEPQTVTLNVKGIKKITADDLVLPGQVEVLNKEQYILEITDKSAILKMEIKIQKGLGYVSKETLKDGKVEVGTMAVDAVFTPIRRVSYEVENMRVGDKTDYNRLRISLETDGTLSPREALERAIHIMIVQLKAIVGFIEEEETENSIKIDESSEDAEEKKDTTIGKMKKAEEIDPDFLKTRIEKLGLSKRTENALDTAGIRTIGGLARKKEVDLQKIEGLGAKGIDEIKEFLVKHGIEFK